MGLKEQVSVPRAYSDPATSVRLTILLLVKWLAAIAHTQFPLLRPRSSTPGHLPAFHCLFSHGEVLVPAELIYVNISTQCLAGDVTLPPLNPSGSWLLLKSQTFNDGDIQLRLDLLLTIIIDLVGLMHFLKKFWLLLCSCLRWDYKLLNIYTHLL